MEGAEGEKEEKKSKSKTVINGSREERHLVSKDTRVSA
jgi:hypothetical protein